MIVVRDGSWGAGRASSQAGRLQFWGIHVLWGHIRVHVSGSFGDLLLNHLLMFNFLIAKFCEKFLKLGIRNDCQRRHIKRFRFSFSNPGPLQVRDGWT